MAQHRVVLGVTGSIAAYKAAELVRLLKKARVDVHVILTRSGGQFITPLTLGTLTGNPVTTDMFEESSGGPYMQWGASDAKDSRMGSGGEGGIRHIQVSRESDLIVVAPASGNILGKVAHGIADDALSTAIMASSAPVLFAPAMNTRMWENPAVRANVTLLQDRGYRFVQPGSGELACGDVGTGRMADPEEIAAVILRFLEDRPAAPGADATGSTAPPRRARLLVTAGRTEEPLDPVRYLSNRSSGKMGYAVAEAGRDRGYRVTLITGPSSSAPPSGVEVIRVGTAEEMAEAVWTREKDHDVLVMAAAVADYRPREASAEKIGSKREGFALDLVPTPDILGRLRGKRGGKVTVGFALETSRGSERARRKLAEKGLDFIVLNNPLRPGSEFGGETNEVAFLYPDGREEAQRCMTKLEVAREILNRVEALR